MKKRGYLKRIIILLVACVFIPLTVNATTCLKCNNDKATSSSTTEYISNASEHHGVITYYITCPNCGKYEAGKGALYPQSHSYDISFVDTRNGIPYRIGHKCVCGKKSNVYSYLR